MQFLYNGVQILLTALVFYLFSEVNSIGHHS